MSFISARNRLRTIALSAQPDTVNLVRVVKTPDGAGGYSDAWFLRTTTTGRLSPFGRGSAGQEQLYAEQLRGRTAYELSLPHDVTVIESDRVVIGERQLEIIDVMTPYAYHAETRLIVVDVGHSTGAMLLTEAGEVLTTEAGEVLYA